MFQRLIEPVIHAQLKRGKSLLVTGARQTGKTTLLSKIPVDVSINLMSSVSRRRYESRPELLAQELRLLHEKSGKQLVFIDEIQKVPVLLDDIQVLIDEGVAQFILTGSSARKLRKPAVNLLPGRVVNLRLDPLTLVELGKQPLNDLLSYGFLPGILLDENNDDRNVDLHSYIDAYLEEEIRAEAVVRNVGDFSRFIELASAESGYLLNMSKLSNEIGISKPTLKSYYEILLDCLVAERVEPITFTKTRRRLLQSNKYLLFDLGVRRIAANEGVRLPEKLMGHLFEQFIGLQLIYLLRQIEPQAKVKFWLDSNGLEVDWVIELHGNYFPIEVKWTDAPSTSDAKNISIFMQEYDCPLGGFVISQTPQAHQIKAGVKSLPWQQLVDICDAVHDFALSG